MTRKHTGLQPASSRFRIFAVAGILTPGLLLPQNGMTRGVRSPEATAKARPVVSPVRYRVTEIPLPYGVASGERLVINAAGDVAGTQEQHGPPHDRPVAFYYHQGTVTTLADKSKESEETHAVALNNHGQILLGRAVMPEGGVRDPFLWEKGRFKSLGPQPTIISDWEPPFGEKKVAFAVGSSLNDAGEIAGYFVADVRGSSGPIYARTFLWKKDKITLVRQDLPEPKPDAFGGYGSPTNEQSAACTFVSVALNRKGELVGYRNGGDPRSGRYHSIVYVGKNGKTRTIGVGRKVDPISPAPTSDVLRPYAANDRGQWVGSHVADLRTARACVWSGEENAVHDLPDLPVPSIESVAYGINNKGLIVGKAEAPPAPGEPTTMQAILWTDGKAVPLNDLIEAKPGIRLEEAHGINEQGQIVAVGISNDRTSRSGLRAYLLTPSKKN